MAQPTHNGKPFHGGISVPCRTGKKGFMSMASAKREAKDLYRKHVTETRLSAYKCRLEDCDFYHLGNLPTSVKRGYRDRNTLVPKEALPGEFESEEAKRPDLSELFDPPKDKKGPPRPDVSNVFKHIHEGDKP